MSSSAPALAVRDLGKSYRIGAVGEAHQTMSEVLAERIRHPFRRRPRETFWALEDVSFDVRPGEVLGIIGRNGAGKSTLLKILSRITEPTTGEVRGSGRVGSLLEVGTGFHPELTGRENVYLNGAILGMSRREINRRFGAIVEFSGIEQFLETPVKRYSSGMYVRLAFAVAAHLDPEILIIDEVLAVGDAEFQRKCLGKISETASHGDRTVLFVSHNMAAVEALCTRCIYLADGRVRFDGAPEEAITRYLGDSRGGLEETSPGVFDLSHREVLPGQDRLLLRRATLRNGAGEVCDTFRAGEAMSVSLDVEGLEHVPTPVLGLRVTNAYDQVLSVLSTRGRPAELHEPWGGRQEVRCAIERLPLVPGEYYVEIVVKDGRHNRKVDGAERAMRFAVVEADVYGSGYRLTHDDGLVFLDFGWEVGRPPPVRVPRARAGTGRGGR